MMEADLSDDTGVATDKTLERYRCAYEVFIKWHESNGYTSFEEDVLLAYLKRAAKTYQSATLKWIYSMLKRTLFMYKNIDITSYSGLTDFLKEHSRGPIDKYKGKTFSFEEIKRFLNEAPDESYLAMKVIMIFGFTGGCSCDELQNITTAHVKDCGTEIIVSAPRNRKSTPPIFLINGESAKIVKKYIQQRPAKMPTNRFFMQYSQSAYETQMYTRKNLGVVPKEIAKFLELDDYKSYTVHSFQPADHARKKRNKHWMLQRSSDLLKQMSTSMKTTTTTTTKPKPPTQSVTVTPSTMDVENVLIKSEIDESVASAGSVDLFAELTTTSNQNLRTEVSNEPFVPMLLATMELMKWKPQYYMGMQSKQFLHLLQLADERKSISEAKLMLTLRKLRLNEDIEVLADAFDLDRTTAERYYNESKQMVMDLVRSVPSSTVVATTNQFATLAEPIIKLEKNESSRGPDPIAASEDSTSEMDYTDDFEITLPETGETKEDPRFLSAEMQRRTAKCTVCHKLYDPRLLNAHMNSVHFNIGNLNKTICGLCWKECKTKALLKAHQMDVHDGASHGCDICGKTFRSKQYLSAHILTKHARVKTNLCDACGEGFPTPYWLQYHKKRKHNEPAHACNMCDMKFVSALSLRDHIVARHTNERPYKCQVRGCGKTFSWPSSFKSHSRVHEGDKFECSICLKGFSFKGNLRSHLKIVHNQIIDNKCMNSTFF